MEATNDAQDHSCQDFSNITVIGLMPDGDGRSEMLLHCLNGHERKTENSHEVGSS